MKQSSDGELSPRRIAFPLRCGVSKRSIENLAVKNYGCLEDVSIDLTSLNAFIGPNDSGKSTILRAVRTLAHFAASSFGKVDGLWGHPFHPEVSGLQDMVIDGATGGGFGYRVRTPREDENYTEPIVEEIYNEQKTLNTVPRSPGANGIIGPDRTFGPEKGKAYSWIQKQLRGVRLVRFDPDALRRPSNLIPDGRQPSLQNDRGDGLPGVYDAIVNRDVEIFLQIQKDVRVLFPTVKRLRLKNISNQQKELEIELLDGAIVPARSMSEGMLLYLAFAAIPHVDPVSVLLVEEPENGLHPARIADVVRILREISKETQVLIATHSPLVVNELEPDEVSLVTRRPSEGTKVTPIAETPNFEERSRVYALGELWLSYADGTFEEPLFSTTGTGE